MNTDQRILAAARDGLNARRQADERLLAWISDQIERTTGDESEREVLGIAQNAIETRMAEGHELLTQIDAELNPAREQPGIEVAQAVPAALVAPDGPLRREDEASAAAVELCGCGRPATHYGRCQFRRDLAAARREQAAKRGSARHSRAANNARRGR